MAVYKVPQDVEADDKLIGPFSFRQFIYLIIVAISLAGAWGLGQLFPVLAILPLPVILFFGTLALPLRKDQPMEAYLSAVVSFYFLKSHKRLWLPDGIDSFVTIIPPKNSERILTKQFDDAEANKRLDYLTSLVDSHGWAIRGVQAADTSVSNDLYYESQQAADVMDNSSPSAQAMTERLQNAATSRRESAVSNMKTSAKTPPAQASDQAQKTTTNTDNAATSNPSSVVPSGDELRKKEEAAVKKHAEKQGRDVAAYAAALAEEAAENRGKPVQKPSTNTSASTPDTDTMELTNKQAKDLSSQEGVTIATIAHQAKRVATDNKSLKEGEEVTISLH